MAAEFKRVHATEAFRSANVFPDDPRQNFVGRVMKLNSAAQEEHTHRYLRWTFLGTVAVMIVGLIGVGLSFMD